LDFSTETKSGITNIATWMTLVMYGLFLNFYLVPIAIPSGSNRQLLYLFLAFVPQAVKLILFGGDSIAHANNTRSLFFRSQFPAKFVEEHYSLESSQASYFWFKLFDSPENPDKGRTTKYGYTCRLVYYLFYIACFFSLLSILFLGAELFQYLQQSPAVDPGERWYTHILRLGTTAPDFSLKLLYLVHTALLSAYLGIANMVRVKGTWHNRPEWYFWRPRREQMLKSSSITLEPRGVWFRWKEINDRNKAWVSEEYSDLEALKQLAIHKSLPHSKPRVGQAKSNLESEEIK
jgi:hypothetical protein